jgi:hypothetical protein
VKSDKSRHVHTVIRRHFREAIQIRTRLKTDHIEAVSILVPILRSSQAWVTFVKVQDADPEAVRLVTIPERLSGQEEES